MPKVFTIDGDNFSDYEGFCKEFSTVVLSEKYEWRGNLDAFNDILFGGFGDLDDGEEYTLVWKNSQKSSADLGYRETAKYLMSITSNPSMASNIWLTGAYPISQRCHCGSMETYRVGTPRHRVKKGARYMPRNVLVLFSAVVLICSGIFVYQFQRRTMFVRTTRTMIKSSSPSATYNNGPQVGLLTGGKTQMQTETSWAFDAVNWHHGIYRVTTEPVKIVGQQVGTVTNYSQNEATLVTDAFSNTFPVGTMLFAIPGTDVSKAIAIKTKDGSFIEATLDHSY